MSPWPPWGHRGPAAAIPTQQTQRSSLSHMIILQNTARWCLLSREERGRCVPSRTHPQELGAAHCSRTPGPGRGPAHSGHSAVVPERPPPACFHTGVCIVMADKRRATGAAGVRRRHDTTPTGGRCAVPEAHANRRDRVVYSMPLNVHFGIVQTGSFMLRVLYHSLKKFL